MNFHLSVTAQLLLALALWLVMWVILIWAIYAGRAGFHTKVYERRVSPFGYWACIAFYVAMIGFWPYAIVGAYNVQWP